MIWATTAKVQNVSALFCQDQDPLPVLERLMLGPKVYQDIEFSQGDNWQVLFGKSYSADEVLLPHIAEAKPLFKAFSAIWLPVGTAFNLPAHVQEIYVEKIRLDHAIEGHELVIIPQFLHDADITDKADIYLIEQRLPLSALSLGTVA